MPATVEAIEELYRSRYASYRGGVAALTGYDAAWVWRIAFRTAVRTRSGAGRELTLDELVQTVPVPRAERDPELAEAVRQLAPRRRLVVYLRYFADLPYAEIASLLDISEGTVAATLSQAHAELLDQLRDKEAVQ